MYVHIGAALNLSSRSILAVLDLDQVTSGSESKTMRQWLAQQEIELRLEPLSEELPRSIVITEGRVYLSPVSALTLRERLRAASCYDKKPFWRRKRKYDG